MKRMVTPELLDSLPADDPPALHWRRERSRINGVMGKLCWLLLAVSWVFPVLAIDPHPDAEPNIHSPGEVDVEENVKYIVEDPAALEGIVLDETDAVLKGQWQYSTHTPPYVGIGYLHDKKSGKGEKSVTWTPDIPSAGKYEVRVSHCYNVRRATNALVTIRHADGETKLRINQQDTPKHGRLFRSLGVFEFAAGKFGSVTISNEGTNGKYVIVDALQLIAISDGAPADGGNSK